MESRRAPLRKAREDVRQRLEAEKVKNVEDAEETENVAPKKRVKKAVAEDNKDVPVSKAKKTEQPAAEAVAEDETKGSDKKKPTSKKLKSKTDDDIVVGKVKTVVKRRSRSVEPSSAENIAKKKLSKKESIPEEAPGLPKKGRGKKAASEPTEEIVAAKSRDPKKKSTATEKEELPVRKGRTRKAASVEPTANKAIEETASVKKARGKIAKPAQVEKDGSEDEEQPEPEIPVKSGKKKSPNATAEEDEIAPKKSKSSSKLEAKEKEEAIEPEVKPKSRKKKAEPVEQQEVEVDSQKKKPASKQSSLEEDEDEEEVDGNEAGSSMSGRKKKAPAAKEAPAKKARGKAVVEKEASDEDDEAPTKSKLQNSVDTDYSNVDFNIKDKFNLKIATWNVAGLRALANKNTDYFTKEDADIICMNELKCEEKDVPDVYKLEGYHQYWNLAKGSGGVAILSKVKPIKVTNDLPGSDFEDEHRLITAEYEKFFLISTYVVNSGRGLKTLDRRLEWNQVFDDHVKALDKKKPVIIAGDMNVSHQEIDLTNPKSNKKNAGFTQEERDGFTQLLSHGFVDTFRHFYADQTGAYTFWSYMNNARTKNIGWRLDYFIVSQRLMKHVKDNVIRKSVKGSDHCPIVLFMNV